MVCIKCGLTGFHTLSTPGEGSQIPRSYPMNLLFNCLYPMVSTSLQLYNKIVMFVLWSNDHLWSMLWDNNEIHTIPNPSHVTLPDLSQIFLGNLS